jgi:hypothetical protein
LKVTEEISTFFNNAFKSDVLQEWKDVEPKEMSRPFTSGEISKAVKALKSNKSPGSDNITAEQLKFGPDILNEIIADMFNTIAKTGQCPEEIKHGILVPLQKPGKEKGNVENLRPIILLNMIRKILAVVMLNRIFERVDNEIDCTQTAYRPGRSAIENIFSMKILCEKAVTATNAELHILMFDMSKAFDSVVRDILFDDLKKILKPDELHILQILLKDVTLQVRCGKQLGQKFTTNIGIPQGDCLSPILFTLYLAKAMKTKDAENDHAYSLSNQPSEKLLPKLIQDHNYVVKQSHDVMIDEQFADDISWLSTSKDKLADVKKSVPQKLQLRNLKINSKKTEEYSVRKDGNDEWKNCKYLGSMLGTEKDICRRKQLSMASFQRYKNTLKSRKLSLTVRIRIFNAYITSIFMYGSETWTLTKNHEKTIDSFQRSLLRQTLNIHWPFKITNIELYRRTHEVKWSEVIRTRRLRWLGHVLRLPENVPVAIALKESYKFYKTQKRTNKKTWRKLINEDLSIIDKNLSLEHPNIVNLASDRDWWHSNVVVK